VSVYNLTDTQRSALDGKNGNYYISAGGLALTYPGKTASGEWFDVTRFVDWLQARLRERLIGLLANNAKVPFTDAGIALVVAEIRAQLQQGVAVGGLAESPAFTISAPLASDVSSVDRAARTLPDVTFSARLAGAIHAIELTGNIAA
jgi:hypothetical protein